MNSAQYFLIFIISLLPLMCCSNEPHVTETLPCKALMTDYQTLDYFGRRNFLEKVASGVDVAIEKYSAVQDTNRLEQAKKLKSCINFLRIFPHFLESLNKTHTVLDKINPSEAPDFMSPDKDTKPIISKLTKEQAWQLIECKPCKEIHKFCQDNQGLLSDEKLKELQENISGLSNGSYVATKEEWITYTNWLGQSVLEKKVISMPKSQDELIPKSIHDKAVLVQKCLEIIKEKQYLDNQASHIENYFQDIQKATHEK